MAHAGYRMKGPCPQCRRSGFVGVCPHGMAVRIRPAPTVTPEDLEKALKEGLKGAKELDKKLDQMFRPPTAAEDLYLTQNKKPKGSR